MYGICNCVWFMVVVHTGMGDHNHFIFNQAEAAHSACNASKSLLDKVLMWIAQFQWQLTKTIVKYIRVSITGIWARYIWAKKTDQNQFTTFSRCKISILMLWHSLFTRFRLEFAWGQKTNLLTADDGACKWQGKNCQIWTPCWKRGGWKITCSLNCLK